MGGGEESGDAAAVASTTTTKATTKPTEEPAAPPTAHEAHEQQPQQQQQQHEREMTSTTPTVYSVAAPLLPTLRRTTTTTKTTDEQPPPKGLPLSRYLGVASFNVLADHNLMNSIANEATDKRYVHAKDAAPWSVRWPRLLGMIEELGSGADVIAMQEVDYALFVSDIKPALAAKGFEGVHQWDAKSETPHPWGAATFFRTDRLRVAFRETRSRALVLGLTDAAAAPDAQPEWFVVNVHLAADSEKTAERLAQLSSTLWKMSLHSKVNPANARVVVLGDFNSDPNDAPLQWLLKGSYEGVDESHAFRFTSAYDVASAVRPTYIDPWVAHCVDHAAFTPDTMDLVGVLAIPDTPPAVNSPPDADFVSPLGPPRQTPLFSETYPSDHYPIGVVLCARAVAPPPEPSDPNACPLTPGQMRVLEFLERGAPLRTNKRGKPSEKELAQIRAHDESLKALTSHLDEKQRAWVAKWRKNYAKDRAKQSEAASATGLRRRSLQRVASFSGLAALFGAGASAEPGAEGVTATPPKQVLVGVTPAATTAGEEKPAAAAAAAEAKASGDGVPTGPLPKRRGTFHFSTRKLSVSLSSSALLGGGGGKSAAPAAAAAAAPATDAGAGKPPLPPSAKRDKGQPKADKSDAKKKEPKGDKDKPPKGSKKKEKDAPSPASVGVAKESTVAERTSTAPEPPPTSEAPTPVAAAAEPPPAQQQQQQQQHQPGFQTPQQVPPPQKDGLPPLPPTPTKQPPKWFTSPKREPTWGAFAPGSSSSSSAAGKTPTTTTSTSTPTPTPPTGAWSFLPRRLSAKPSPGA